MKTIIALPLVLSALSLLSAFGDASAQSYAIDWSTIAGGGVTFATGGPYSLGGTIGQPDAGAMTGGSFSLTGGFWSLVAVQTPGAPLLSIVRQGGTVHVSWPLTATNFVLDESPTAAGLWSQVAFPYATNGNGISVSTPALTGKKFYRLRKL
jgi:hypothetical protein